MGLPGHLDYDLSARTGRLAPRRSCGPMAPNYRVMRSERGLVVGSVIKKRRKRMAKKKHRKLLKRTRVQRRNKK